MSNPDESTFPVEYSLVSKTDSHGFVPVEYADLCYTCARKLEMFMAGNSFFPLDKILVKTKKEES